MEEKFDEKNHTTFVPNLLMNLQIHPLKFFQSY